MAAKTIRYYKKIFMKRLSTVTGVLTLTSTVFCGGVATGVYVQKHLNTLEQVKREGEYNIQLIQCETEKAKGMNELEDRYRKEVEQLKDELYEIKQRKH